MEVTRNYGNYIKFVLLAVLVFVPLSFLCRKFTISIRVKQQDM